MKGRLHIILGRLLMGLLIAGCGLALISAVRTKDGKPCAAVQVYYGSGESRGFMKPADVLAVISQHLDADPVGCGLNRFDLGLLERSLEENVWVKEAQLYFDNKQVLHVVLHERIPVARLIDQAGGSCYLDEESRELPLSPAYRADVPVFTGLPAKRNSESVQQTLQRVRNLSMAIAADSFWLRQAAQIDVDAAGRFLMYPAVGQHVVDLGDGSNVVAGLERLKIFYRAMASRNRLDDFARISVAYEGQVVAQRVAGSEVSREDKLKAVAAYRSIVKENKTDANTNSVVSEKGVGRIVETAPEPRQAAGKTQQRQPPSVGPPAPQEPAPTPKAVMPKAVMPPPSENNN